MNEEIKKVLERLGFEYNKEKNYWIKTIIPSGDEQGAKYNLYYRDGDFWTMPHTRKEFVDSLGEVILYKKHMDEEINIFEIDLEKPLQMNIDGIQKIIELSVTPKEFARKKEEERKEGKKEEERDDYYNKILEITGYDIFEIFGDSGTGKSKIALAIAKNVIENGRKVFYYDTEGNITKEEAMIFEGKYVYNPFLEDLYNIDFPDIDLIIIDSVTYPFWIAFASMNLKERGEALLKLHALLGRLKEWCVKNKKLAIVVSQATSEMGKEEEERKPFGGKAFHIAKEVVKTELNYSIPEETVIEILSYRMRRYGRNFKIADVIINDKGVRIKWRI